MSDMRVQALVVVGAVVIVGGVSLWGQTLADVARKEEERRKAISTPAKVYTNKDLTGVPGGSSASGSSAETADAPRATAAATAMASSGPANVGTARPVKPIATAPPAVTKPQATGAPPTKPAKKTRESGIF